MNDKDHFKFNKNIVTVAMQNELRKIDSFQIPVIFTGELISFFREIMQLNY